MISFSDFKHTNPEYDEVHKIDRSQDFRVYHNGKEVPVYTCRISKYPFNRMWPGHQRLLTQTEVASYVNLVSDEDVTLEVEPLTKTAYDRIMLKPYSKGVKVEKKGDRLVFTLKENGGYVLELDDYHGLLYVFCGKPVVCEDPASVTYYFGPGIYFTGKITLRSNESIYVDKDALIYGCVYAEGAENVRVFGNGIFDDGNEERVAAPCYVSFPNGNAKFFYCKNVRLEGVGFTNSAVWCINIFECSNVMIDGISVFGQWRYNTDGVDIMNSDGITIRNSFIHSFDDSVCIKGLDKHADNNNRNMLFENLVTWCDWGMTLELGLETNCSEYYNITFRSIDILRSSACACDISNGDCAFIHDVTFEDIRIEMESFYTPSLLQRTEDMEYDRFGLIEIPLLFKASNNRLRVAGGFYGEMGGTEPYRRKVGSESFASVSGVRVKNVSVICDEEILSKKKLPEILKITARNVVEGAVFDDIIIEGITLNGRPVSLDDITLTKIGQVDGLTILP